MGRHTALYLGLFLVSAVLTRGGLALVAMMLFPLPVSRLWCAGEQRRAWVLVGCAVLSGVVATGAAAAGIIFGVAAFTGVVLGSAVLRYRQFGRVVTVLTAYGTGVLFTSVAANWDRARRDMEIWIAGIMEDVRTRSEGSGAAAAESSGQALDSLQFVIDNLPYLYFGSSFGFIFLLSVAAVGLSQRWLTLSETPVAGRFDTMRPPEWLVWAVIAVSFGWFAEQQWSHPWLRGVTWNSALGLLAVYWMNGLSILIYAMKALQMHWIVVVLMGLFAFQAYPVLCIVGLFDTWWPVRERIARVAAARQSRLEDGSDENE